MQCWWAKSFHIPPSRTKPKLRSQNTHAQWNWGSEETIAEQREQSLQRAIHTHTHTHIEETSVNVPVSSYSTWTHFHPFHLKPTASVRAHTYITSNTRSLTRGQDHVPRPLDFIKPAENHIQPEQNKQETLNTRLNTL